MSDVQRAWSVAATVLDCKLRYPAGTDHQRGLPDRDVEAIQGEDW